MPYRYKLAGAVSLVVGGLTTVLQFLITPVSGGDLSGSELVATVTRHHTAMGWALALDLPLLLAAPAYLFLGSLAGARTSRLASTATAFLFFPFVVSCPPVFGFDGFAFLAGADPNKEAMAHLATSWQDSAWWAIGLFPYVLLQIAGSIMLGIAFLRSKPVPSWVAIGTMLWPALAVVGIESGVRAIAVGGYAVLFATWSACAAALLRDSATIVQPAGPERVGISE
ncbi:MAG TPA: hypothetical protein VHW64_19715 [Nocardioides sp.]|uniref:hypothetical protein n=1 Tax=Nocardioides sp. TaxID=35761 RepID=UPI002E368C5A|nr:hypothetical protein [Nocardioides sp.]HEX3932924.1 hypothetical protein [Nocardioides sp.]